LPTTGINGKKKVSKKMILSKKSDRLLSRESSSEIDGAESMPKLTG
jgi:hypothetical protein